MNRSATVEPGGHSLNLSWQLWQRMAGQIVERRRQLGQVQGRGWRWQRAWAQMARAAATVLLVGGMLLTAPVYASGPSFTLRSGVANPLNGMYVGTSSTPTFADLDADGDLDAFSGEANGTIVYYKNTGSARVALFTLQTGGPLDGLDAGDDSAPAFADIDADGDLDLFVGSLSGTLAYYQNTGTPQAPVFTQQTGAANPFDAVVMDQDTTPAFADIDGDGDLDAFVGGMIGTMRHYQNTGTPRAPVFTQQTGAANLFDGVAVGNSSTPAFVDLDGDGDLDAFIGNKDGFVRYYQNTGTRLAPRFSPRTDPANPFNGVDLGDRVTPVFADIDADGDPDLFTGGVGGVFFYYQNNGANVMPVRAFTPRTGAANPFNGVDVGQDSTPAFADIDGDGDLDAFVGEFNGVIFYYKNTGTASAPVLTLQTGADNPLNSADSGQDSTPAFVDIDADGDLDLFTGSFSGPLFYYKNTGTPQAPVFTQQTGTANPFDGVSIGGSSPTFADIDADGDLDAFIGNKTQPKDYSYYQNTGTPQAPVFTYYTGPDNPFNGVDFRKVVKPAFADVDGDGDPDLFSGWTDNHVFYIKNSGTPPAPVFQHSYGDNPFDGLGKVGNAPAFADLDGDGDLDAFIGNRDGSIAYYENSGDYYRDSGANLLQTPSFTRRSGANNPFDGLTVGGGSRPTLADLDGDGDPDALVGAADGTLRYDKNTGSALAPVFVAQSGAANPFDGVDVGDASAPILADLDGDGDLDAVIGAADGTIRYYKNTGNVLLPAFTAQTGAANFFSAIDAGDQSAPSLVDIDGDGDLDAFVGVLNGNTIYYENTGTALAPVFFISGNTLNNPLNGVDVGQNSTLTFADVDHDGDLDALLGGADGGLLYYRNTGTAVTPVFSAQSGADNPFSGVDLGDNTAPAFADIDGDGDMDVFSGDAAGNIHYFEHTHCSFATESDAALAAGDVLQFGTGNSALFVKVNTLGSLSALTASCTPNNHPNASSIGLRTGVYWTISPNAGASGFDLDLTLPYKNPDGDDRLCRYDALGGTWGCAQTSRSATDVTLTHVTALSDWVASSDTSPTALGLHSLTAHSQSAPGAGAIGLLGLLAGLGGLLAGWLRRKK